MRHYKALQVAEAFQGITRDDEHDSLQEMTSPCSHEIWIGPDPSKFHDTGGTGLTDVEEFKTHFCQKSQHHEKCSHSVKHQ